MCQKVSPTQALKTGVVGLSPTARVVLPLQWATPYLSLPTRSRLQNGARGGTRTDHTQGARCLNNLGMTNLATKAHVIVVGNTLFESADPQHHAFVAEFVDSRVTQGDGRVPQLVSHIQGWVG